MTNSFPAPYIAEAPGTDTTKVIFLDFSVSEEILAYYQSLLSQNELARLENIQYSARRNQFITTRGLIRKFIADCTHTKSKDIKFKVGLHGKPECIYPPENIHFNISHSNDYGVIALNLEAEIGIDIQHHRSQNNIRQLAKRFFTSSEYDLMARTSDSKLADCFYPIWVRKEALLKAVGAGLAFGLGQYSVADDLQQSHCLVRIDQEQYHINDLCAPKQYSAALATKNINSEVIVYQWQHGQLTFEGLNDV